MTLLVVRRTTQKNEVAVGGACIGRKCQDNEDKQYIDARNENNEKKTNERWRIKSMTSEEAREIMSKIKMQKLAENHGENRTKR